MDSTKGTPLGLLWQPFWARDGRETGQKASARWVNTMREVEKVIPDHGERRRLRALDLVPLRAYLEAEARRCATQSTG